MQSNAGIFIPQISCQYLCHQIGWDQEPYRTYWSTNRGLNTHMTIKPTACVINTPLLPRHCHYISGGSCDHTVAWVPMTRGTACRSAKKMQMADRCSDLTSGLHYRFQPPTWSCLELTYSLLWPTWTIRCVRILSLGKYHLSNRITQWHVLTAGVDHIRDIPYIRLLRLSVLAFCYYHVYV